MKNIISIIIFMVIGHSYLMAQQTTFSLGAHHLYGDTDTLRSFVLSQGDKDLFITKITGAMQSPIAKSSEGNMKWENIAIPGVGDALVLEIEDGIFERDASNNIACFNTFKTVESKKQDLKKLKNENVMRMMQIYIKEKNGNIALLSEQSETIARNYLLHLVAK